MKQIIPIFFQQELKIKAGAEKLREATTDRRALSEVAMVVKQANSKLNELQAELQQLESQIILTQGQPQSPQTNHSNGQGQCHFFPNHSSRSLSFSDGVAFDDCQGIEFTFWSLINVDDKLWN